MNIDIDQWYSKQNEWISFITLLVQDGNEVTLDGVKFVMEDPESVAQISGILWYKLFPNQDSQRENYHNKKASLKIQNKDKKQDNPWNIYENPFLYSFESDINLVKSIDLNKDGKMTEQDLVNDRIYKSFLKLMTILEIISKTDDDFRNHF